MSLPTDPRSCTVCGQQLLATAGECPSCHASDDWQDLIGAMRFAHASFEQWARLGMVNRESVDWITLADGAARKNYETSARQGKPVPSVPGLSPRNRCWSCGCELVIRTSHCPECGAPVEGELVRRLRYWDYTAAVVKSHNEVARLPLAQAHSCLNEAKGRIAMLRSNLEKQRQPVEALLVDTDDEGDAEIVTATVVDHNEPGEAKLSRRLPPGKPQGDPRQPPRERKPRRPLWEILLDPRSIQWLLGFGGALFVLGLVIWLAALGIFKNALVVATALGAANAFLLGSGWTMTGRTRYQTAGRALTLLACLVMPLNLWFYDTHGLVTLADNLWVAALVCCVFYAATALVLRDSTFVYVLAGGVAMTGLLILAQHGKFVEIAAPSTLLVALGVICVHVERAFADTDGPFSRRKFGLAFFWSGQTMLGAGLLLLLGAQIAGDWLYQPLFEPYYRHWNQVPPEIVTQRWGQLLALGLVLAGTYAYAYSDLVVRRIGVYIYLAVFTLLWGEVLALQLFVPGAPAEAAIIALALTALVANLMVPAAASVRPLARTAAPMELVLSTVPVVLGALLYFRATSSSLRAAWPLPGGEGLPYVITWWYVGAMALTAASCRIAGHVQRGNAVWMTTTCFFGAAAATLLGLAGLLSVWGVKSWEHAAAILMIVPILYSVAARLYRGSAPERPLVWAGHAATGIILLAVAAVSTRLTPDLVFEPVTGKALNLSLALIFAEAALFFLLNVVFGRQGGNLYLCTLSAAGAIWQLLHYAEFGPEYYTLAFAVAGFVLLAGYRIALWERAGLGEPAFHCANALMSLSLVAAALMTLSRMATRLASVQWTLVALLTSLAVLSLLAAWIVRHAEWRRWYVVMAITETALAFLAVHLLTELSIWQKMEIFSIAVGAALLAVGHIGWYRERESQEDLVSFSLLAGSLLVGLPLTFAVIAYRSTPEFSALDEFGMLAAAMLLLASGFVLRLRATTLTGTAMMTIYLLTLLCYVGMLESVQRAAVWMTIGGGTIFGAGLILSIYRDRLLTLPDRVKRREGLFRILTWR